jgi:hypothetical protein
VASPRRALPDARLISLAAASDMKRNVNGKDDTSNQASQTIPS